MAGLAKSTVRGRPDTLPPPAPSTAFSQGSWSCFRLDSTLMFRMLHCLILCLVIMTLMNITVLLSHLLKKYSQFKVTHTAFLASLAPGPRVSGTFLGLCERSWRSMWEGLNRGVQSLRCPLTFSAHWVATQGGCYTHNED